MLQGISEALNPRGYELMVGVSGLSLKQEEALLRAFVGRRPEGIILSGTEHSAAARVLLGRAHIPIVETWALARRPLDLNVGYSEEDAAAAMVDHLFACGYRSIAFICGPLRNNERARRRRQGFLAAARRHGLATDRIVQLADSTTAQFAGIRNGAAALGQIVERWPETDCVFCSSDTFAVGALFECQRRRVAVPAQLGIAGFLGLDLGSETEPQLTTVRVPRYEIGRTAAALLLGRMQGDSPDASVHDLGFSILERGSTRATSTAAGSRGRANAHEG
jgi:LacI family gluconate utilization system Gnt-I transcriptional repressor